MKFLLSVLGVVGTCWAGDSYDPLGDLSERFGNLEMKTVLPEKQTGGQPSEKGTPDFPKPPQGDNPYKTSEELASPITVIVKEGLQNSPQNTFRTKKLKFYSKSSFERTQGRLRSNSFCEGSDDEENKRKVLGVIQKKIERFAPIDNSPKKPGAKGLFDRAE